MLSKGNTTEIKPQWTISILTSRSLLDKDRPRCHRSSQPRMMMKTSPKKFHASQSFQEGRSSMPRQSLTSTQGWTFQRRRPLGHRDSLPSTIRRTPRKMATTRPLRRSLRITSPSKQSVQLHHPPTNFRTSCLP